MIGTGLLLVAAASRGEDQPPAGAVLLPEVEVTAEPASEAEQRAPTAFVTDVDVGSRNRALDTTADALSESAGVQVQHFGGLGAFSTISIRGSSANQVPVYLDGVPLSQSQDQTVDLSTLPLDSLERIEVYRGTVPVGFGGGGIGGVVNLVTKPPSATPSTEMQAGYGSFETRKIVVSHTQEIDGFDVLGHVTYLGSKGNFTYFDDNGTPENPTDDGKTTRINNQFDAVGGLARVARDLGDGLRVDGTQEVFYRTQGVPGPATVQFREPNLDELRSLTYLRLSATGLADVINTSGTLYGVYNFQRFFSPPQDFGPYDTNNQTGVVGGSNTGTWFTPWQQSLSWFDEVAYEQFFPYNAAITPAQGPDQTRLRLTLAAQDEVRLFDERLLLVPSVRYEHLADDFSGVDIANQPDTPPSTNTLDLVSPTFGAMARLTPWASLRGNVGYFQRAPNFAELFGNSGTVLGNGELKPEKGLNADIGATASWTEWRWIDRALLELALFNTDYRDLITFEATSPDQFRAMNIGKARVRGLELSAAGAALHHFGLQLNYTHQQSEDQSGDPDIDGNQLPLRPDDELFVRLETFVDWASTYYEYTFISSDPTSVGNFITVPSRSIHTIGATVRPYPWMAIEFQAANISNADIRDLGDFPLPGLTLFGSITVTL